MRRRRREPRVLAAWTWSLSCAAAAFTLPQANKCVSNPRPQHEHLNEVEGSGIVCECPAVLLFCLLSMSSHSAILAEEGRGNQSMRC